MKRVLSLTLVFVFLLSLLSFSAQAVENDGGAGLGTIVDIEYLDDGSYIVTYLDNGVIINPGDGTNATTVTKSKTKKFYNSAGETMWYVRVVGTFRYNGSTSTCTEAAHKAAAIGVTWSIVSASHSKSGATATATATARHTSAGGYSDFTRSVSLTCSPTGVFS